MTLTIFDLETTGLSPEDSRIFLIAVRDPDGNTEVLEGPDEADLIRRLVAKVQAADPDVIENHNLQGFDLPFLDHRASVLRSNANQTYSATSTKFPSGSRK
jgi:DNA polymerase elongation subunit (family B)